MSFQTALEKCREEMQMQPGELLLELMSGVLEFPLLAQIETDLGISSDSEIDETRVHYDALAGTRLREYFESYLVENYHDDYHDFGDVKGCEQCEARHEDAEPWDVESRAGM